MAASGLHQKQPVKVGIQLIILICMSALLLANFILNVWYANKGVIDNDNVLKHSFQMTPKKTPSLNRERHFSNCNDTSASSTTCSNEKKRLTSKSIRLTPEDLSRSRAWVGNEQRLANLVNKLQDHDDPSKASPITVVVCGGSITLGHGLERADENRYSHELEQWLNEFYPLARGAERRHRVLNRGSHGADMCAMAKRIDLTFDRDFEGRSHPDLIVLEFAVNDYQGQDHRIHLDHKTDLFFDGFREKVVCAEAVVRKLYDKYPRAALLFLEAQTAILNRKTAQVLHMGVAQHYQIPVVSYAEVIMPGFYRLIETLKPYKYSSPKNESILPYPHGCVPCELESILKDFRHGGCKSICQLVSRSNLIHMEQVCRPVGMYR